VWIPSIGNRQSKIGNPVMPYILFLSVADQVRGPLAAAILKTMIPPEWNWRIESAGTWCKAEQPLSETVRRVMRYRNRGVDLSQYCPRMFTLELLEQADLVLVMEKKQKEIYGSDLFPALAGHVYLLSEMFGVADDIVCPANPYVQEAHAIIDNLQDMLKRSVRRMYELVYHTEMSPEAYAQWCAQLKQAGKLISD
jgi:protein-tyrosine-phosphatase